MCPWYFCNIKTVRKSYENEAIQHFVSWGYAPLLNQLMGQSRDRKLLHTLLYTLLHSIYNNIYIIYIYIYIYYIYRLFNTKVDHYIQQQPKKKKTSLGRQIIYKKSPI